MRVTIERMTLADLGDVMRMERQCFPTPWRPETFEYEISGNPNAYYVVARLHLPEGPRNVGYAGMWLVVDEAHITTIGVDPSYRGLKIGERLLLASWRRRRSAVPCAPRWRCARAIWWPSVST